MKVFSVTLPLDHRHRCALLGIDVFLWPADGVELDEIMACLHGEGYDAVVIGITYASVRRSWWGRSRRRRNYRSLASRC